jgi:hypothetical protein
MKYRKKPVVIDAEKVTSDNQEELAYWCNGLPSSIGIEIPTLEGTMLACEGDYIIKGVKGEFYPCKPDIFEATYDEVAL